MELFSGPGSLPLRPDARQQGPVDGRSRAELCQVNKEEESKGNQTIIWQPFPSRCNDAKAMNRTIEDLWLAMYSPHKRTFRLINLYYMSMKHKEVYNCLKVICLKKNITLSPSNLFGVVEKIDTCTNTLVFVFLDFTKES